MVRAREIDDPTWEAIQSLREALKRIGDECYNWKGSTKQYEKGIKMIGDAIEHLYFSNPI